MSLTRHQKKQRRARSSARKDDLPRAPSGALSRSAERYQIQTQSEQKDAKLVVMQARQRVYGLNAAAAGAVEAGSSIGRLLLARQITKRLYEAANRFAEDVWAYHSAIGIPHPSPRAQDVGRVRGLGGDRSAEQARAISNAYMRAIGVIKQADRAGRPVETVLRDIVVLDVSADNYPPHMINWLRHGLEPLADHYGIPHDGFLTVAVNPAHAQVSSETSA